MQRRLANLSNARIYRKPSLGLERHVVKFSRSDRYQLEPDERQVLGEARPSSSDRDWVASARWCPRRPQRQLSRASLPKADRQITAQLRSLCWASRTTAQCGEGSVPADRLSATTFLTSPRTRSEGGNTPVTAPSSTSCARIKFTAVDSSITVSCVSPAASFAALMAETTRWSIFTCRSRSSRTRAI